MTTTTLAGTAGRFTGIAGRRLVWVLTQIDWAEVGQIVWHGLISLLVCTYLAGEFTGRGVHRTNDELARAWVRLWVPATAPTATAPRPAQRIIKAAPAPVALLVMAQAAVQTAPSNVAPPRVIHISDPMARAIRMVRTDGRSQRLAAFICGVSRSSLQRALKA